MKFKILVQTVLLGIATLISCSLYGKDPFMKNPCFKNGVLTFFPWNEDWNNFMYPDEKAWLKDMQLLKKAGLTMVRLDFLWDRLEPSRGEFNFDYYDSLVKTLKENKIEILGLLGYCSTWANDQKKWNLPPKNSHDFHNFAFTVASRYKKDIHYWEIWNEPNIAVYFEVNNWPVSYVPILKEGYTAVKKADPKSVVLHGGLAQGVSESLEQLYQAGAKPYFDRVNIHPFVNPVDLSKRPLSKVVSLDVNEVEKVMKKYGDHFKKIWITELGCPGRNPETEPWNAESPKTWFLGETPHEEKQADFIYDLYTELNKDSRIEALFWAFLRDTRHFKDDTDYLGFLHWDSSPKKAYLKLCEALSASKN